MLHNIILSNQNLNYYKLFWIAEITMENDKDIKIETGEDLGLDDKIKEGARALDKKIEDPDKYTGVEYEAEKAEERVIH